MAVIGKQPITTPWVSFAERHWVLVAWLAGSSRPRAGLLGPPHAACLAGSTRRPSYEDVLRAFPTLTPEHLLAVVAFAASTALKGLPLTEKLELETAMSDSGADLDDDERGRLEAALQEAVGRFDEGDPGAPADDAFRRLGERLR